MFYIFYVVKFKYYEVNIYHIPLAIVILLERGEKNECDQHLNPGITCHLARGSLPKQKPPLSPST